MNMGEVYVVFKCVVDCVRNGEGFILIEIVFYCFILYFFDDDDSSYCFREEVDEVKGKDLLKIF